MKLPNNWTLFKSMVLEKIRTYCKLGVWPYDYDKFTSWLSNFNTHEDEYVALHLLDSLIIRSNEMAVSGYSRLLHGDLREYLIKKELIDSKSINEWMMSLKSTSLKNKITFLPVRLKRDYGESGSTLFRLLSRHLRTEALSSSIQNGSANVIILVDDFLGGGTQFEDFASEIDLPSLLSSSSVIYCPLIALNTGITYLDRLYPTLKVMPVEILTNECNFFYSGDIGNKFRNDCDNTVDDVKNHYLDMKKRYAVDSMRFWLGKDDAGLTLAFEWGCPNQSLSILWMEYSAKVTDWRQLFGRRS